MLLTVTPGGQALVFSGILLERRDCLNSSICDSKRYHDSLSVEVLNATDGAHSGG